MRHAIPSRRRRRWIALGALAALGAAIWVNNTSLFAPADRAFRFLAHRGLAQTFDVSQVAWDTNTAAIIDPPEHEFIENTIPSMRAAFACGADVVELDVKLTQDNELAVFHDSTLEYRTGVSGEVSDYTMAQLKAMDVGYGYTADGGKTYPFRGKGVGLMPTLEEVLAEFEDRELLLHVKDASEQTYRVLWEKLRALPPKRLERIAVYGDDEGISYLRSQSPTLRLLSAQRMKRALLIYESVGFTGYVPRELHNMELHIPLKYAKFLWGWPAKFVQRMQSVGTRVVIVAGDGGFSEGFDTLESLEQIPDTYAGYVWTNRIDRVAAR